MTFENIVAQCEIAHDEHFLLWQQCFQLYLITKLSLMESFLIFDEMFSKSSATDLLYVGCSVDILRAINPISVPTFLTDNVRRLILT